MATKLQPFSYYNFFMKADYNKAIELDPDDGYAYLNRGIAKENAGLPYCSDYKKACELGEERACGWYNQQCR